MAGLKKKRRIQLIVVGMGLLAVAAILVGVAFKDGIEFYRSPTDLTEQPLVDGQRFRLGGLVLTDSWQRGETHVFVIHDGPNQVEVHFKGILPDLFEEDQGTIVTGALDNGIFIADEVLAKHDEEYMPAEVIDTLKEQGLYVEPET